MTAAVHSLWRHPIKAHGREEVSAATLIPGQCLPGDRVYAVAHEASKADGSEWARCSNFTRAAGSPALMAITSRTEGNRLVLSHPGRPDLDFDPATQQDAFLDWVAPLMPEGRAAPARLVRAQAQGMTDSSWPSVTLCSLASHRAVEKELGQDLSLHRWRGNIWLDGLEPWQEFDWIGRELRLGGAILKVRERTTRCLATASNPETGLRDADTLGALDTWGHRDFSVKAEVTEGGAVRPGDRLELL